MFMLLATTSIAWAGWTPVGTANDCEFFKSDQDSTITPMRAVCDWPTPPDDVIGALDAADTLEDVFSTIHESSVLSGEPGQTARVYQLYKVTSLFKREVVLSMASEEIPGGRRFLWKKADDQSALTGTATAIDAMENLWEVTGTATGCRVVFEVSYAPGGRVPGFLITWFQGTGVQAQLADLRSFVTAK